MMANNSAPSFPVESDSFQAAFSAALVRISEIPAGSTLVDDVSSEIWAEQTVENIAAGCTEYDDNELDNVDCDQTEVA